MERGCPLRLSSRLPDFTSQGEGCRGCRVLCSLRKGTPETAFRTSHLTSHWEEPPVDVAPTSEDWRHKSVARSSCGTQREFSRASHPKRTKGQTPQGANLPYSRGSPSVVYRPLGTLRALQGLCEVKTIFTIILRHLPMLAFTLMVPKQCCLTRCHLAPI